MKPAICAALLIASTASPMVSSAASPDASWFESCLPSDGAGQALPGGSALSFYNPLPRDSGALFLGITLAPHSTLRFSPLAFEAVGPSGEATVQLRPTLLTFQRGQVDAKTESLFKSLGQLNNATSAEGRYVLHLAENSELPDRFTLAAPAVEVGANTVDTMAVHYKRFASAGYVQVCGVNGATRGSR